MPNTYTKIYLHIVFAVKFRDCLISREWKNELYKYITGIVQNNGHKLIVINGMPDHVHILIGLKPDQSISDLMQDVKGSSSKWINEKGFTRGKFNWQQGYGAFSYSDSQLDNVIKYIENQEEHHKKKMFREEYLDILKSANVDYNEKYLFDWIS
jgi:putative transposase